jgi:pyrimidine operon attenuation protein/uracil phosphoribosyltransferase
MSPRIILTQEHYKIMQTRFCHQLIENHDDFSKSALIGLQPRGISLARSIKKELETLLGHQILYGELDTTFFRDDFRQKPLLPQSTSINFLVDDLKVVLIDDVLFTGRSIRSALDALQHHGRPAAVELLVLIDRRLSRHVPVQPDYSGITVDAVFSEKVKVVWENDCLQHVELVNKDH